MIGLNLDKVFDTPKVAACNNSLRRLSLAGCKTISLDFMIGSNWSSIIHGPGTQGAMWIAVIHGIICKIVSAGLSRTTERQGCERKLEL